MKNRLLKISINDLIVDPNAQAEMLTVACGRQVPMAVKGACQVGDSLLLHLEECPGPAGMAYVFAPLCSLNTEEIITEIGTRFFAGFSLIAGIDVNNEKWALYCHAEKENK
ncbi:MAG: hypothetical protein JW808_04220 [Victivallales bacterium]|nr:hypothetical protein [Victivallales bacterium]